MKPDKVGLCCCSKYLSKFMLKFCRLLPPPAHDGKILICGRDENSDPVAVTAIFNERIKKVDWETMNNFDTL